MLKDRVKQTTTTTGTGAYQLIAPPSGYQSFAAALGSGASAYYVAVDGTNWEIGTGTVTAGAPDTLSRTVLKSSNGDNPVNWGAGTKTVFCSLAANRWLYLAADGAQVRQIPGGASSAPALAFEGDLNTGIFNPAADTLGIATGGTERLRVNSSGSVGIGTTPAAKLHVLAATNDGLRVSDGTVTGVYTPTTGGSMSLWTITNHPLTLGTNNAERLRILADGKIGIGKTNPATALDVNGTVTATAFAGPVTGDLTGNVIAGAGSASAPSISTTGDSNTGIHFPAADTLGLATGGTERLRVDSSGNVGIGMTPGTKLDITASVNQGVRVTDGTVTGLICPSSTLTHSLSVLTTSNHPLGLGVNNVVNWYIETFNGALLPSVDNARSVGYSGNRASAIWAANGTIQTSDARQKTEISESALGLDFLLALRPVSYKWIVGGNQVDQELDGEEEIEVQETQMVTRQEERFERQGDQLVRRFVDVTQAEPVFDVLPVLDETGQPVMELVSAAQDAVYRPKRDKDLNLVLNKKTGAPVMELVAPAKDAVYRPLMRDVPRMTTMRRPKYKTVITPRPGARTHWGMIAQEVKAALPDGLDFGGYVEAEDGSLALRYDQFIAPIIKGVQELAARVAALENHNH